MSLRQQLFVGNLAGVDVRLKRELEALDELLHQHKVLHLLDVLLIHGRQSLVERVLNVPKRGNRQRMRQDVFRLLRVPNPVLAQAFTLSYSACVIGSTPPQT